MGALFAPCCAVCKEPLVFPTAGAVCEPCWLTIRPLTEPLCRTCGDALATWRAGDIERCVRCARQQRVISVGRAVGAYEGTLREIVHALKYDGRRSVARPLARLMTNAGTAVLQGADIVVPVPLHIWRLYRRGFNQAAEIARWLDLPCVNALRRRRATVTQTDLPEAERHRNVGNAFAVRRRARSCLHDTVIVLVDDVSTTGATVDACASVLIDAGAREVRVLTAARAVSRLP